MVHTFILLIHRLVLTLLDYIIVQMILDVHIFSPFLNVNWNSQIGLGVEFQRLFEYWAAQSKLKVGGLYGS